VNSATSLYGIFGNPVGHSLSPAMHNSAFAAVGYNGVYLAFTVSDIEAAVNGIRALGVKGVSVTIPYKVSVMDFLDEVDGPVGQIGAVNTVINRDGLLKGYNSDGLGAIKALTDKTAIRDREVVILGAGGAARAIGFGIISEGGHLTIVNRTVEKGECLARELGAEFRPLADIKKIDAPILINTTSVGMTPHCDDMPVKGDAFDSAMVVMDIVYNPVKTRLLKTAEAMGCETIDGVAMLVNQGAFQFKLWTGIEAPIDIMKKAVYEAL